MSVWAKRKRLKRIRFHGETATAYPYVTLSITSLRAADRGLPVSIVDEPLTLVVLGTGMMLTDFKLPRGIAIEWPDSITTRG